MLSACHNYKILVKLKTARRIFEKPSHFMKVQPMGAVLYHEEGRMDTPEEANICFS
jgi:hypothetical protein